MAFQQQQQQQYGQQQPMQQQQPQSQSYDPWGTSSGGAGPAEFVFTVEKCEPGSSQQDPMKQTMNWSGRTHTGSAARKSWGIGKDWIFDWNQMPPRYADPKNATRQVNENSTFGVLLRCITTGQPFDLTAARSVLQQRPGGPLSPGVWQGTVWHMCRVVLDFGQGPREVPWPIAFLGVVGGQIQQPTWRDPSAAMGSAGNGAGAGAGFGANPPAPNGQQQAPAPAQQQYPTQQQYLPQQQQQYAQPPQQFANTQQQYAQPQQQPMQQYPPQQQQAAPGQYQHMPPGGYGAGVHPGFQGGGPAAGQGFPGQ